MEKKREQELVNSDFRLPYSCIYSQQEEAYGQQQEEAAYSRRTDVEGCTPITAAPQPERTHIRRRSFQLEFDMCPLPRRSVCTTILTTSKSILPARRFACSGLGNAGFRVAPVVPMKCDSPRNLVSNEHQLSPRLPRQNAVNHRQLAQRFAARLELGTDMGGHTRHPLTVRLPRKHTSRPSHCWASGSVTDRGEWCREWERGAHANMSPQLSPHLTVYAPGLTHHRQYKKMHTVPTPLRQQRRLLAQADPLLSYSPQGATTAARTDTRVAFGPQPPPTNSNSAARTDRRTQFGPQPPPNNSNSADPSRKSRSRQFSEKNTTGQQPAFCGPAPRATEDKPDSSACTAMLAAPTVGGALSPVIEAPEERPSVPHLNLNEGAALPAEAGAVAECADSRESLLFFDQGNEMSRPHTAASGSDTRPQTAAGSNGEWFGTAAARPNVGSEELKVEQPAAKPTAGSEELNAEQLGLAHAYATAATHTHKLEQF